MIIFFSCLLYLVWLIICHWMIKSISETLQRWFKDLNDVIFVHTGFNSASCKWLETYQIHSVWDSADSNLGFCLCQDFYSTCPYPWGKALQDPIRIWDIDKGPKKDLSSLVDLEIQIWPSVSWKYLKAPIHHFEPGFSAPSGYLPVGKHCMKLSQMTGSLPCASSYSRAHQAASSHFLHCSFLFRTPGLVWLASL